MIHSLQIYQSWLVSSKIDFVDLSLLKCIIYPSIFILAIWRLIYIMFPIMFIYIRTRCNKAMCQPDTTCQSWNTLLIPLLNFFVTCVWGLFPWISSASAIRNVLVWKINITQACSDHFKVYCCLSAVVA